MNVARFPASVLATLLLVVLLTGCATQKIDWNGRIGNYTFDQAIVELGPSDKKDKLSDGTLVAEWLTRRGYHHVYATGGYYGSPHWIGPYPSGYLGTSSPDYFLRLTFGTDGRLQAWKQFAK